MQAVISRVHRIVSANAEAFSASSGESPAQPNGRPSTPSAASETVDGDNNLGKAALSPEIRLVVERVQFATLLGERKSAVSALHEVASRVSSSPGTHAALGFEAIPVVLHALISDPRDTELMEAMLEFLQQVVATSPATATALLEPMSSSAHSAFGAPTSGIEICLELLQDPSPWIRGPTVTLVKCLQEAEQKGFAAAVLACKEGLRRLLEVVEDKREHIRDAALQVLVKLTEREKNVQQFLAFEDGFVRLFEIMDKEGLADSNSSVISDCLQIVNNMVRDNFMTQTLLRELPYLETHLPSLLRLPAADESGSRIAGPQKKRALKLALQLIRFMVAPLYEGVSDSKLVELARRDRDRKDRELAQLQSFVGRQTGLMSVIGELACCCDENLTDVQLQALDFLQLLVKSNGGNQIIIANLLTVPSKQNMLSALIGLDCSEEETPVSDAGTALVDAIFRENETTKMTIFQHIIPPPGISEDEDISLSPSPGRMLMHTFIVNAEAIASDRISVAALRSHTILMWKAANRLASLLASSSYCKQLALRIPRRYDDPDALAVPGDLFFTRCLRLLASNSTKSDIHEADRSARFQMCVAVLLLLIQWCRECTSAVREIVGFVTNLSILVDCMKTNHGKDEADVSVATASEISQIKGLVALLLGCCLEYMVDSQRDLEQQELQGALLPGLQEKKDTRSHMTREQLVDMITKRIGLAEFTDALVQFQQCRMVLHCARASRKQNSRTIAEFHESTRYYGEDFYDHEYLFLLYERSFTTFFRKMSDKIQKRIISIYTCGEVTETSQSGSPANAMIAYQDLIRMQDAQLQDLQKQLEHFQAQTQASASTSNDISGANVEKLLADATKKLHGEFEKKMQTEKQNHQNEKNAFEKSVQTMKQAATELETRFNGLSLAFEQLETDHSACDEKIKALETNMQGGVISSVSHDPGLSGMQQCKLNAELAFEREAHRNVIQQLEDERIAHRAFLLQLEEERNKHMELKSDEVQVQVQENHDQEEQKLRRLLEISNAQLQERIQMTKLLRSDYDSSQKELEKLKYDVASLHDDVDRKDQEIRVLKKEVERLSNAQGSIHTPVCGSTVDWVLQQESQQRLILQLRDAAKATESGERSGSDGVPLAVDNFTGNAAAKELFQLWDKQRAKTRELKQAVDKLSKEKASLEVQADMYRYELKQANQKNESQQSMCDDDIINPVSSNERLKWEKHIKRLEEEIQVLKHEAKQFDDKSPEVTNEVDQRHKGLPDQELEGFKLRMGSHLSEVQGLRELLEGLERALMSSERDAAAKAIQIDALEQKICALEANAFESKQKANKTINELEDELAHTFLERKELQHQFNSKVKGLEQELAHLYLTNVGMGNGGSHTNGSVPSTVGTSTSFHLSSIGEQLNPHEELSAIANGTVVQPETDMDDMLILLASMQIQCEVLRESLETAKGSDAVATAMALSQERGAIVL